VKQFKKELDDLHKNNKIELYFNFKTINPFIGKLDKSSNIFITDGIMKLQVNKLELQQYLQETESLLTSLSRVINYFKIYAFQGFTTVVFFLPNNRFLASKL
jgi:hypothetical protein